MEIPELRVIDTGLDPVTAEREQWDDGNNTLALAPGVVVAYERNTKTNARLAAEGIEVLADRGLRARHRPRRPALHVVSGHAEERVTAPNLSPERLREVFPAGTASATRSAGSGRASSSTRPSVRSASCSRCRARRSPARTRTLTRRSASRCSRVCCPTGVGEERGELRAGESVTVPAGVVHDWWNAGDVNLRARVTVTPPGRFAAMIGAVWGLAVAGRTGPKGMPKPVDAALMAEAFGDEIVFVRPPRVVQRALAATVAPIARRRGRSVTGEIMRAAIVPPERWPGGA